MSSISTSIDGRTSSHSRAHTREDNVVRFGNPAAEAGAAASKSATTSTCSLLGGGDGEVVAGADMSVSVCAGDVKIPYR